MTNPELKKYYYFSALIDIAKLFAEREIGSDVEIDIEAAATYVNSFKFVVDYHDYNGVLDSKESMYKRITDEIIAGLPIWQLLKLSDWTKSMLERSFAKKIQEAEEIRKKIYKCYTCEYLSVAKTSLGVFEDCKRPKDRKRDWRVERKGFEPQKKCKYYVRKKNNEIVPAQKKEEIDEFAKHSS